MKITISRTLFRVGLLVLMFSLGLALATLSGRNPLPPQGPPAHAPAPRAEPRSPSEVVAAYWGLSLEGRPEEAARHLTNFGGRPGVANAGEPAVVKRGPPNNIWSGVIRAKRLRIVSIEQEGKPEESGEDDTMALTVKVTSEIASLNLNMRHVLTKDRGEWKIYSIY
jgi:hypothetical protein